MTDRELLSLAAKAAGIPGHYHDVHKGILADSFVWNPLASNGDALSLAVGLKMKVTIGNGITMVEHPRIPDVGVEFYGDPEAATRRAIVRAAAAIGKAMP